MIHDLKADFQSILHTLYINVDHRLNIDLVAIALVAEAYS